MSQLKPRRMPYLPYLPKGEHTSSRLCRPRAQPGRRLQRDLLYRSTWPAAATWSFFLVPLFVDEVSQAQLILLRYWYGAAGHDGAQARLTVTDSLYQRASLLKLPRCGLTPHVFFCSRTASTGSGPLHFPLTPWPQRFVHWIRRLTTQSRTRSRHSHSQSRAAERFRHRREQIPGCPGLLSLVVVSQIMRR
jgi:hypothetical protein